jgi:tRNA threonylcarbamoyladenosine biosynthesis protein TsaB
MTECLLTIDTSTPAGSVALSRGEELVGEVLLNLRSTHSDRLLPAVQQLLLEAALKLEDLDAFGVVLGPGSFTGLRVGVATVKGLALATGKPVVGVSSLQTLALQLPYPAYPLSVWLDARKQEVYVGRYHWEGGRPVALDKERVAPPEQLLEQIAEDMLFIGSGAAAYRSLIVRRLGSRAHFVPWPLQQPRASSAAALALDALRNQETISLEMLEPSYIRLSEAEIMLAKRAGDNPIEG